MTHPQGQDPQQPEVPPVPGMPRVPSPYEGTPAEYGQPTPSPYTPSAAPGPYGALSDPGVPDPYATGQPTRPLGTVPMTWRTILAYVLCPIAILFMPIGGLAAIVLAVLGMRNHERTARVALGMAIVCTILAYYLSALAQSQLA